MITAKEAYYKTKEVIDLNNSEIGQKIQNAILSGKFFVDVLAPTDETVIFILRNLGYTVSDPCYNPSMGDMAIRINWN